MSRQIKKLLATLFVTVVLASCGGGGDSKNDSAPESAGVAGRAIKGAIKGGTVICYDKDGNELQRTTTNENGDYKLKNECPEEGKLVVRGGIDKSTGEQIEELVASGGSKYITPVTTMEYVSKKYGISLTDKPSQQLINDAKTNNPSDKTLPKSKQLLKMAVVLHSMVKNLQQQSEDDLSYEEAMVFITEQMKTKPIKKLSDDTTQGKKDAKDLVKKVFDDLEKNSPVKIPPKNRDKIEKIIDEDAIKLQEEDLNEDGLKDYVPPELREPLPMRYVRITTEKIIGSNYELEFKRNKKYGGINNLEYECKIFTKSAGKGFTYRSQSGWQSGDDAPCKIGDKWTVPISHKNKFLVIKYNVKGSSLTTYGHSSPHKIGSKIIVGENKTMSFGDKVYLPVKGAYSAQSISTYNKSLGALPDLETGNKKMGYLPVGFYYKPSQVPTNNFKNVKFGVKLNIGSKELIMMIDRLYITANAIKSATATNPYLHGVHNTTNWSWRRSMYYHNATTALLSKTVLYNLNRNDYNTKSGFLRFKKPTVNDDVLKMGVQSELEKGDDLVGVSLADMCNRPIWQSGKLNATLCDYIRSTINAEEATSVKITPFIKAKAGSLGEFKTNQSKIKIQGIDGYMPFPAIIAKGSPDATKRKIGGKKGLQGIDSDGDGVSDYDEMLLGRKPFSATDKNNDKDRDGFTDLEEIKLNLNPNDGNDIPEITIDKNEVNIKEDGSTQQFSLTFLRANNLTKSINVVLKGGAENVVKNLSVASATDIVASATDILVVGTKQTITITPKKKFGVVVTPHIIITSKISKGSFSKSLKEKRLLLLSDEFVNVLRPKTVVLSYKDSVVGSALNLNSSPLSIGNEITATVSPYISVISASITARYRWQNSADRTNWVTINDATSSKYVVRPADANKFIRLETVYQKTGKDVDWNFKRTVYVGVGNKKVLVTPNAPTTNPTVDKATVQWGTVVTITNKINGQDYRVVAGDGVSPAPSYISYNEASSTISSTQQGVVKVQTRISAPSGKLASHWSSGATVTFNRQESPARLSEVTKTVPQGSSFDLAGLIINRGNQSVVYTEKIDNDDIAKILGSMLSIASDSKGKSAVYTVSFKENNKYKAKSFDITIFAKQNVSPPAVPKLKGGKASESVQWGTAVVIATTTGQEYRIKATDGKSAPPNHIKYDESSGTIRATAPGSVIVQARTKATSTDFVSAWTTAGATVTFTKQTSPVTLPKTEDVAAPSIVDLAKLIDNNTGGQTVTFKEKSDINDIASISGSKVKISDKLFGGTVVYTATVAENTKYLPKSLEITLTVNANKLIPLNKQPSLTDNTIIGETLTVSISDTVASGVTVKYQWQRGSTTAIGSSWEDIATPPTTATTYTLGTADVGKYIRVRARLEKSGKIPSDWRYSTATRGKIKDKIGSITFVKIAPQTVINKLTVKANTSSLIYYVNTTTTEASSVYIKVELPSLPKKISTKGANIVISDGTNDITVPAYTGDLTQDNIFKTANKAVALFELNSSVINSLKLGATYTVKSLTIPNRGYVLPQSIPNMAVEFAGWATGFGAIISGNKSPYAKLVGDSLTAYDTTVSALTKSYKWQWKKTKSDGACVYGTDNGWNDIVATNKSTYVIQPTDEGKCIRVEVALQAGGKPTPKAYKSAKTANAVVVVKPNTPTVVPTMVSSEKPYFKQGSVITAITTAKAGNKISYNWQQQSGDNAWVDIPKQTTKTYTIPRHFSVGDKIRVGYAYRKDNVLSDYLYSAEASVTKGTYTWHYLSKTWNKPVNLIVVNDVAYFYKTGKYNLGHSNNCSGFSISYTNSNGNVKSSSSATADSGLAYSVYGDSYEGYKPYIKIDDMNITRPFKAVIRCKKASNEDGQNGPNGGTVYSSDMDWNDYKLQISSPANLKINTKSIRAGATLDLARLIIDNTGNQPVVYREISDTDDIAKQSGINNEKVTISTSAKNGQVAIYEVTFVKSSKYVAETKTITITVRPNWAKPTEVSVSKATVEWKTAVIVATTTGQEYRLKAEDGSSVAPSHISYDSITGKIKATAPGDVKLQTRKKETAEKSASDWTDGIIIKFTKATSQASYVAEIKATSYSGSTYYNKSENWTAPINPGGQIISYSGVITSATPWSLKQEGSNGGNNCLLLVSSSDKRRLIYIRKGTQCTMVVTFAENTKYKAKSFNVRVYADKDSQNAPPVPTVNTKRVEWNTPVTVTNKASSGQDYRLKAADGSSVAPNHITYDSTNGKIVATAPGKVILQTRKAETATKAPSVWVSTSIIEFIKITPPVVPKTEFNLEPDDTLDLSSLFVAQPSSTQTIKYEAKTDDNNIATQSGPNKEIVTISSEATSGQFAIYTIKFFGDKNYIAKNVAIKIIIKEIQSSPITEASVSSAIVEWVTAVTIATVSGQEYRIVHTDGSSRPPANISYNEASSTIIATSPGDIKLQTRKKEIPTAKASPWTAGRTIKFTKATSQALYVAEIKATSHSSEYYNRSQNWATPTNPGGQTISYLGVTTSDIPENLKQEKPNGGNNCLLSNTARLIYIRKGTQCTMVVKFVENSKYKAKSFNVRVYADKDSQSTPPVPTVDKKIVEWNTAATVTNNASSGQDYRLKAADGSSVAPSHITYDSINGKIVATAPGKVILQTRMASTPIKFPSGWASTPIIEFTTVAPPLVTRTAIKIQAGMSQDLATLFTAQANSTQTIRYEEKADNNNIGSLATSTVTFKSEATPGQSATYTIKFVGDNKYKAKDVDVVLTIVSILPSNPSTKPTTVSSATPNTKYIPGATITATAPALANHTIVYKWQTRTGASGAWSDIAGATGATYVIPNNFTVGHRIRVGYAYVRSGASSSYIWGDEITVVEGDPTVARLGTSTTADLLFATMSKTQYGSTKYYVAFFIKDTYSATRKATKGGKVYFYVKREGSTGDKKSKQRSSSGCTTRGISLPAQPPAGYSCWGYRSHSAHYKFQFKWSERYVSEYLLQNHDLTAYGTKYDSRDYLETPIKPKVGRYTATGSNTKSINVQYWDDGNAKGVNVIHNKNVTFPNKTIDTISYSYSLNGTDWRGPYGITTKQPCWTEVTGASKIANAGKTLDGSGTVPNKTGGKYLCVSSIGNKDYTPQTKYKLRWKFTDGSYSDWSDVFTLADIQKSLVTPTSAIITGANKKVGTTITATGSGKPSGATAYYQWQKKTTSGGSWSDLSGETTTSTLSIPNNVGHYLRVKVRFKQTGAKTSEWKESSEYGPVVAQSKLATPTSAIITGANKKVGTTITATGGGKPSGATAYYQWQKKTSSSGSWSDLGSETTTSTLSIPNNVGHYLRVKVRFKESGKADSEWKESTEYGPIVAASSAPAIDTRSVWDSNTETYLKIRQIRDSKRKNPVMHFWLHKGVLAGTTVEVKYNIGSKSSNKKSTIWYALTGTPTGTPLPAGKYNPAGKHEYKTTYSSGRRKSIFASWFQLQYRIKNSSGTVIYDSGWISGDVTQWD